MRSASSSSCPSTDNPTAGAGAVRNPSRDPTRSPVSRPSAKLSAVEDIAPRGAAGGEARGLPSRFQV